MNPSSLQSLVRFDSQCKPFLKVEVYRKLDDEQRRALYRSITGYGYVVHKIADDGNYFGEIVTEQDLSKWRHFDVFCVPARLMHSAAASLAIRSLPCWKSRLLHKTHIRHRSRFRNFADGAELRLIAADIFAERPQDALGVRWTHDHARDQLALRHVRKHIDEVQS